MRFNRHNLPIRKKDNPEVRLQLAIIHYLRGLGYVCGKTKTMGVRVGNTYRFDPYTFRGFPDLVAFVPGLVFIEVKSPKGRLSPAQKKVKGLCQKAGVTYIVARSLDDVEVAIKAKLDEIEGGRL